MEGGAGVVVAGRRQVHKPVGRVVAVFVGEAPLETAPAAIRPDRSIHRVGRPRGSVFVFRAVDEDLRRESGVRVGQHLRGVGAVQLDVAAAVAQFALVGPVELGAGSDAHSERPASRLSRVGFGVEVDHEQIAVRREEWITGFWEFIVDVTPNLPAIGEERRIFSSLELVVQIDSRRGDVPQLDEFIHAVVIGAADAVEFDRVVMNFVDDHGTHADRGVGFPQARAEEVAETRWHSGPHEGAEGEVVQQHKFGVSVAGDIATEGIAVGRRAERDTLAEAEQLAGGVGLEDVALVAPGGVERERARPEEVRVAEIFLVKNMEPARRNDCVGGELVVPGVVPPIAHPPVAHVHRVGGDVLELDGVLQRRVGVAEQFVDDDLGDRAEIGLPGRGVGKDADTTRAVGHPALGDVPRSEQPAEHHVDDGQSVWGPDVVRVENAAGRRTRVTAAADAEVQVVRGSADVARAEELHVAERGDVRMGRDRFRPAGPAG